MTPTSRFLKRVIRIVLVLGLAQAAVGCVGAGNKNAQAVSSVAPPDFVMMVLPTTTSRENYDKSLESDFPMTRGIMVQINPEKIDLAPENFDVEVVRQRASLFVDGQLILQDTLMIADGIEAPGGPYYLSWAPALEPGTHAARFQFVTDAGETVEYRWQIEIKE